MKNEMAEDIRGPNELVGAGEPWLQMEEESNSSQNEKEKKTPSIKTKGRSRKRAHLDVTAKPPDPVKQSAGLKGVEAKAKKRDLSEMKAEDSTTEPEPKKAKREQIAIGNVHLIMNHADYVDNKGNKFTISYICKQISTHRSASNPESFSSHPKQKHFSQPVQSEILYNYIYSNEEEAGWKHVASKLRMTRQWTLTKEEKMKKASWTSNDR